MAGKTYIEELDAAITGYRDLQNQKYLFAVLDKLFEGIDKNFALPCPAEMDENADFSLLVAIDEQGKESICAYTNTEGLEYPIMADVKLRSLVQMMANGKTVGFVLNPGTEHELTIPKWLLLGAMAFSDVEE